MKIEHKIKLIENFLFTPEELSYIDEFPISEKIENDIEKNNYDSLIKYLEKIISNNNIDDRLRLKAAYFNSRLKKYKIVYTIGNDDIKEDFSTDYLIEDEDGNEDFYMYNYSEAEKIKQREAVIKFNKLNTEEISMMIHNFVWDKFNKIHNGFDRSIYSDAKNRFWNENGILLKWEIPENLRKKIKESEYIAQNKLKESFRKIEEENIKPWTDSYLKWLQKKGINKYTKQNIKEYFKEVAIKVSDTTIDKIKMLANNL